MKLPGLGHLGGDREEFREFVGCAHGWNEGKLCGIDLTRQSMIIEVDANTKLFE